LAPKTPPSITAKGTPAGTDNVGSLSSLFCIFEIAG